MDKLLISVVIPIYNVEKYLDKCIESVIKQTYSNLEIILVDDGSPDNCPAMCDAWAKRDSRIKVIHKENGGLTDARNYGVRSANGDYLAFVDSDDWVEPEFISTLYNGISENSADVVQCNYSKQYVDKSVPFTFESHIYDEEEIKSVIMDGMADGRLRVMSNSRWNKLYKTEIVKKTIGLCNDSISMGEDFLMNFAVFGICKKIVVLDTIPLYNYRFNEESISSLYNPNHKYKVETFNQNIKEIAEFYGCYKNNIDKLKQIDYIWYLYYCINSEYSYETKFAELKEYEVFIDKKTILKYAAEQKDKVLYITMWLFKYRFYRMANQFLVVFKRILQLKDKMCR